MCYKHHISLPAVLISPIIILLLSGSDEFLFISLEEMEQISQTFLMRARPCLWVTVKSNIRLCENM